MPSSLPDAIVGFLSFNGDEISDTQHASLNRLARSNSATEAWQRFYERVALTAANVMQHSIIYRILEIERAADSNEKSPDYRKRDKDYYTDLANSATKLTEFFNKMSIPDVDSKNAVSSAAETNRQIRAARLSLEWMTDYLRKLERANERMFDREFPASQKRNQPHLTFAIQLCREFEGRYQRPAYELVTELTRALYNRLDDGLQANIEKAYRADREKRPLGGRLSPMPGE